MANMDGDGNLGPQWLVERSEAKQNEKKRWSVELRGGVISWSGAFFLAEESSQIGPILQGREIFASPRRGLLEQLLDGVSLAAGLMA